MTEKNNKEWSTAAWLGIIVPFLVIGGGLVFLLDSTEITGSRYHLLESWSADSAEVKAMVDEAMRDGKVTEGEFGAIKRRADATRDTVKARLRTAN